MSRKAEEQALGRTLARVAQQWGERPVWMLNLLQFKNPYPGAGAESYRRYTYEVRRTVRAQGGHVVAASFNVATVIGQQRWDGMILVQYPVRGSRGQDAPPTPTARTPTAHARRALPPPLLPPLPPRVCSRCFG